jgi:nucleoside 2-deoxyribosyltransferase
MLREGKKPSKNHIKNLRSQISETPSPSDNNTGTPSVYLAGSMDYEDTEHQTWRSSVAERGDRGTYRYTGSTPISIKSPTEVSYSHGAGHLAGVANDDMNLIEESDAILAYIERKDQVGTITEVVYAVTSGMPALVLFDMSVVPAPDSPPTEDLASGVEYQFQSPVYWFLINFMTRWDGLDANITTSVVSGRDEIKDEFIEWNWHQQAAESILEKTTAD